MAITAGTRIGAYEVTSQLGEGGMGVVYRARDTKLLRDAALKVLPDHFADDPDRLSLLQREAQLLASLNHPNIAQIYGLEQIGNTGCIAMELVEGETLADKIKRGPLPIDEAIEIAKQIADALAAAHEKGIVHRDLKPANVKLTPSGTVKVLDFGLAKAFGGPAQVELSDMPTKVSGSIVGGIVGTVGYMSPEQARGKEVDTRTDIWAFGCVLYEMLTGRLAFHAETATDMIAKIVTADPDLSLLPPSTPASIRLLLAATLNKNMHQRLQHIGDMRLFLDQKFFPTTPVSESVVEPSNANRRLLVIAVLGVALLAALIPAFLYFRTPAPTTAPQVRFELAIPDNSSGLAVSPDGKRIAYLVTTDGVRAIWIRPLASEIAQRLTGTDNATAVVWSRDSQRIAFVADGKIKKTDIAGSSVQIICDAPAQLRGFSWSADGVMMFGRGGDNIIARVSESGGEVKPVTSLDASKKESLHAVPVFLPDNNHFIYAIVSQIPENQGIYVGSLDGQMKKRIGSFGNNLGGLIYSPDGYLLMATGTITAQPFDTKSFTLSGQPSPIAEGALVSVSDTGLLIYRKPPAPPAARQLTWYDRSGKTVGTVGESGNYSDVQLSPKGDRLAVDIVVPGTARDIWVIDIARAVQSRITFETTDEWNPSWSADGTRLIFASAGAGGTHIHEKSSSGAGMEKLVFESTLNEIPVDLSPDGRYIPFSRTKIEGGVDLFVLDTMQQKTTPFIESKFDKAQAKLSPDGRWVAYTTNETGTYQIVVQSFPDPAGGKWQISAQGGIEPKWKHDGRELYYLALDGKLMAVPIKGDRTIEAGTPAPLFETPLTVPRGQLPRTHRYDVAPDGRFLFAVPKGNPAPPPILAVMNWLSGLEKK